jgi:hypothetical protein
MSKFPEAANVVLEESISLDELYNAVKAWKPHKAPGHEGIPKIFFNLHGRQLKMTYYKS